MKVFTLIILAFVATTAVAEDKQWKFAQQYDISEFLRPKFRFLGYIEPKYRRLKIEFKSVQRDPSDPKLYLVKGHSQVGKNICQFSGTITMTKAKELSHQHFGVDDQMANAGIKSEGEWIGDYEFKEDNKKNCGIFKGEMRFSYYIDKDEKIRYDDIEGDSDSYKNNQYKGHWISYADKEKAEKEKKDLKSVQKVANWGENRIPDSGDLDIGAGDFSPNPKYMDQGWDDIYHWLAYTKTLACKSFYDVTSPPAYHIGSRDLILSSVDHSH